MLWEIEIQPQGHDGERERVCEEFRLLHRDSSVSDPIAFSARGYLVEGEIDQAQSQQLVGELLLDSVVESAVFGPLNASLAEQEGSLEPPVTVLLKPGVMSPVAQSVSSISHELGIDAQSVRTYRRYYFHPAGNLSDSLREMLFRKVLANDAIEQIVVGPLTLEHLGQGSTYQFEKLIVPLRSMDDDALVRLSKEGQLALSLAELKTIQEHFVGLERDPTDVELETFAQTWSEHCSHKTLKGIIDFYDRPPEQGGKPNRYGNLLKETIFAATQELRQQWGDDDWCVSVFEDNAGVVQFTDEFHACFKVETHNHPSAIEPYGGANTGIGGVIRDPLGTALGAKPICNTDVFCFASPDYPTAELPPSVLHPLKVMKGVVAGVRDYGNRMGIPTVNGAVCFDDRYLGNPLVFCGTVGLIPVDRMHKETKPGDLIVAVGGRTGRDGIHGATFSSVELTEETEHISGGAVQIGNAITEKKVMDIILQAREAGLYNAITDCGAGGFSSAVGEMGADLGATVHLEQAPLKYTGLTYTEIWISEAQERMVLAVPEENWPKLKELCDAEDVEAAVLGTFEATGQLRLYYKGNEVADLAMEFLHDGRPAVVRQAWVEPVREETPTTVTTPTAKEALLGILASLNVRSKEWIIRQYDHEVQAGSVIKPLVGVANDGPSDAAVVLPVLGRWEGLAVGCGVQPHLGNHDPYAMACVAIDEAVRNVVAVGADPSRISVLDNFCWGNTNRPEELGALVRSAEACRDVALAYRVPFISGKDSLNNEFLSGDTRIVIPPTLLISAMGIVRDVRKCVSMDLKEPGNVLYLVGETRDEMVGSHYHLITGQRGGSVPMPNLESAPRIFETIHTCIEEGLLRACHDLSEGGLAVALAEMAFAGDIGTEIQLATGLDTSVQLFSESCTRFLVEVPAAKAESMEAKLASVSWRRLGTTTDTKQVSIVSATGETVVEAGLSELKAAWQTPLWRDERVS